MQLNIVGFTKKQKAELAEAASFFANILMDPRTVRNLTIDIEHTPKNESQGECVDEDGVRNPRYFTINIRSAKDDDDIIQTLAHEMVHVKQHAKNELKTGVVVATRGGLKISSKWMGKIWKPKGKEDHYYDSPWEVEAYGREVGLYQRWLTRHEK